MTADIVLNSSSTGTALQQILAAEDIEPGSSPSYQACKILYLYHPLGMKMADAPPAMAQSQERDISIADAPDEVSQAFKDEWVRLGVDDLILGVVSASRVYGVASIACLTRKIGEEQGTGDLASDKPLPLDKLDDLEVAFNTFDPLNTAGSLVLNQNPNSFDFMKHKGISVSGRGYHRTREVTVFNERPVYISYTQSAFGFVGRSVYQRALYPMKTFIQTMITDDLVVRKSGVLIATVKEVGAVVDKIIDKLTGRKREIVAQATTGNVISISLNEKIETLNMQNLDGAYGMARGNVLKNIATAADMPAKLLENETMVLGFGEGTEDARAIAAYVGGFRRKMLPLYNWFDAIVQRRAWNEKFYNGLLAKYPSLKGAGYEATFYAWRDSFAAVWPNLLQEPDSERGTLEKSKCDVILGMLEKLAPNLDPDSQAAVYAWVVDNLNENQMMFPVPLQLDPEALADWFAKQAERKEEQEDQQQEALAQGRGEEEGGKPAQAGGVKAPPAKKKEVA